MKKIEVYEVGDKVFWLNSDGFQEGKVVRVQFTQNEHEVKMEVRCKHALHNEEYMGDTPEKIFTSWNEMVKYYENLK